MKPLSCTRNPYNHVAFSLLAATLFFIYLFLLVQWRDIFEIDPDEGYNLIKAFLLDKGYVLYEQIWSDQPPLLTYLLRFVFNITNWDVNTGRILISCFASLLIFSVFDFVRRSYGCLAAICAVIFLIYSRRFVSVSVAVMLGIPSLAMATLSGLGLLIWHETRKSRWLVFSGTAFGLSLSIKLFTLFLVPIIFLSIFMSCLYAPGDKKARLSAHLIFFWVLACVTVCVIFFYPLLINKNYLQLITSHKDVILDHQNLLGVSLKKIIIKDKVIFLLGTLGLFFSFRERNFAGIFAGLWLIAAFCILSVHYPIWYHHAFLLLIPASMLSGSLVFYLSNFFKKRTFPAKYANLPGFLIILIVCIIGVSCSKFSRTERLIRPWHTSRDNYDWQVVKFVNGYTDSNGIMITSRQMYAFRTKHVVPPFLAVTSRKRYYAGLWNGQTVLACLRQYHPDMIILTGRWPEMVNREIEDNIRSDYSKVLSQEENEQLELFVSNDLVQQHTGLTSR